MRSLKFAYIRPYISTINRALLNNKRSRLLTMSSSIKYLSQDEAIALDKELFSEYAFSVDQLMELAGLSVAQVIAKCYPKPDYSRPVICVGPGNNGGDGLVCARHLKMFGYLPVVICPKPGRTELFNNLMIQCRKMDITILDQVPDDQRAFDELGGQLLIDSIFGFSFKPPNRNVMFAKLLQLMHQSSQQLPLVSIDIPSGWDVEQGDSALAGAQAGLDAALLLPSLNPDCLISLTAPKLCAKSFKGRYHYLGGRFCPESIVRKYQLNLPEYPTYEGIVALKHDS